MSLHGRVEYNKVFVKNSNFLDNVAVYAGAVGFLTRHISNVGNGVNSNQMFADKYVYGFLSHMIVHYLEQTYMH